MARSVHFDAHELLPAAWRALGAGAPPSVFNPALLADGRGWLFAYRVVGTDQRRRIAICKLDAALGVVPDSPSPLSDGIRFAGEPCDWFADPRLYRFGYRLYLYWNEGWREPENRQFLVELDAATLMPRGCARELRLAGPRRPIEKNWMLLGDDPAYAVYAPMNQVVLSVSFAGERDLEFRLLAEQPWDIGPFRQRYGELRGGAPPQRVGDRYVSFCHAIYPTGLGYDYAAAAYRFEAAYPFRPTDAPLRPLRLENPLGPDTLGARLNPQAGEIVYPCGAAYRDGTWFVSYGINDKRAAIALLSAAEVEAAMRPLALAAAG